MEGGCQDFSSKVFCATMSRNFRKGTLLCCVPEKFRQRKGLWIRGGKDYQDFPSKSFCLTMPKTFAQEPFVLCFRRTPAVKRLWIREGYQDLPAKGFLSQSAESFVGEKFSAVFQKNSGVEKLYG